MNAPDLNAGQWMVDVRPRGEILTASAGDASIELGVLGIPSGYSAAEIEGWLHDLIGVARETAREDERVRPIPALLHHGLTGLLFSHAQLWNRDGERHPASYAVVRVNGMLGFGWIGAAEVSVTVAGAPADPGEVIVRDDEGREARAFELPGEGPVEIHLTWSAGEPQPLVELDARWEAAAAPGAPQAAPHEAPPAAPRLADDDDFEQPRTMIPAAAAFAPDAAAEAPAAPAFEVPVAPDPDIESPAAPAFEVPVAPDPDIESPAAPRIAPQGPVTPMEGIERETFAPFPPDEPPPPQAEPSFLESDGEPLDLGAGTARPVAPPAAAPPPAAQPPGTLAAAAPPPRPVDQVQAPAAAPPPVAPGGAPPLEPAAARAPSHEPPQAVAPEAEMPAPAAQQEVLPIESHTAGIALDEREGDAPEPIDRDRADEGEARPSRLRRMFARFAIWRREEPSADALPGAEREPQAHDVPGVPQQVPPTPESPEITERAVHAPAASAPDHAEVLVGEAERMETVVAAGANAGPVAGAEAAEPPGRGDAPIAESASGEPVLPAPFEAEAAHAAPPLEPHVVDPAAPQASEPAMSQASEPAAAPAPAPPAEGVVTRTPMHPHWPSAEELRPPAPLWKRPWAWAVVVVALFAGGWLIGHMNDERRAGAARGVREALRAIGIGGARFEVMVNSRPAGAWITLDGKDLARRTPATVEMEPGEHDVTLSFSDLGGATFQVRGTDGDRVTLNPALWGSLNVYSSDAEVPVAVAVDGVARGFAPTRIDSLQPGAHDVRFSGPGLPSWGQTVEIRVGEGADLIARPMTSPATGVIEVRASLATATGSTDVDGAQVWLDARPAGTTPLTLELPRGPHSIRIEYQGESAPVQVIDLPGGNQRFANFMLNPGTDFPTLTLIDPPAVIPLDRPTVVSAALEGVDSAEIHEMWLHVQTPDGPWRRYQMAWLRAPGGTVGVAVFPTTLFDADGHVECYVSAATQAGDEYFSEIQVMSRPDAKPPAAVRKR